MKAPYYARICTAIDDTVIELVRFVRRKPCATDWNYWLDGREHRCWVERPTRDKQCISARWEPPVSAAAHYARARKARRGKINA